jgi:hypothetical protein
MKNGKKIAGSSLLSVLGVVCFATILVSAIVLSQTVFVTKTPANYSIQIGAAQAHTGEFTDLPATPIIGQDYDFEVVVTATSSQAAILTVAVTAGSLSTLEYWIQGQSAWTPLANTGGDVPLTTYTSTGTWVAFHVKYDTSTTTTIGITAEDS